MRYQNSREAFLTESKYVGQVSSIVSIIINTTDKQTLHLKGQELNRVIQNALAAHISSRDLITIEQQLANGAALSDWADQNYGEPDMLLNDRKFILQNAFEYLDERF